MEIYLLGQFQVSHQGKILSSLNHARLQELLAYLLLQHGKPVARQQLAFLFWPDSNDEQARTNLRNLLHRLKKALPANEVFLNSDETTVQWNSGLKPALDVLDFETALQQAAGAFGQERIELLGRATSLYGGDLLPGCYSDWLLAVRERLRQDYATALANLAELHEEQHSYSRAILVIQELLRLDPLNENTCAWLMRLHAQENNRGQALHVYHRCAELLRRELGVEPGPALRSLYRQLLETAALRVPTAPTAVLITRQAEWEQLTHRWQDLLRQPSTPSAMLITGECGIGKTHLAQAFVAWVQRQGSRIASATCYETSTGLPYAPIASWLSRLYEQDNHLVDKLPAPWRREISRLLPELQTRDASLTPPGSMSENWQLLQFFEALRQVFCALPGPLLLFIDDIQWCDPHTLAWLAYLQTRPAGEKIFLLATARSETIDAGHPAMGLFSHGRAQNVLELQPMDAAGTRLLVEQLQGGPVEPALSDLIFAQSEGNPFFATELVRSGLHASISTPGPLPGRVRAVIDWRLERLSASARQMLELAAVIGRSFSYELLKAAGRMDEQTLVNALDECWRQRILREKSSQSYDFSHEILRQAVYDGLSTTRRRMWHELAARALEHLHANSPDRVAEQIALHLEQAGLTARASLFYERAAVAASKLYALPQAARLFEQSLRLLDFSTTPRQAVARLYEQAGSVLFIRGRHQAARDHFTAALRSTPPGQRIDRARLLRQVAQTWSAQQRYRPAGIALLAANSALGEQFTSGQESEWTREWLDIRIEQLHYLYFINRPDDMQALCDLLEAPLKRMGSASQQAEFYALLGMLNNRRQRYRITSETLEAVRRGLELAEQIGDPLVIARKRLDFGFNLLWSGDISAAIRQFELGLSLAEGLGATSCQNQALAYLGIAYRLEGKPSAVMDFARRGLALAEAENHATYQGTALANLAWLAYKHGDLQNAESLANSALQRWQAETNYPTEWLADFPLAAIALQRGNLPAARERLAAILQPPQQRLPEALETRLRTASAHPARENIHQALNAASQLGYL